MKFCAQSNLKYIALASMLALIGCNSSNDLSGPSSSDETTLNAQPLSPAEIRKREEAKKKAAEAKRRAADRARKLGWI